MPAHERSWIYSMADEHAALVALLDSLAEFAGPTLSVADRRILAPADSMKSPGTAGVTWR